MTQLSPEPEDRQPLVRITPRTTEEPRHPIVDAAARDSRWRAAIVGAITLGLVLAVIASFDRLLRPIGLLLAAIILAQAAYAPSAWLDRWLPRPVAVVLVYLAALLVLVGIGWLVVPRIVEQGSQLAERIPELLGGGQGQGLIDGRQGQGLMGDIRQIQGTAVIGAWIADAAGSLAQRLAGIPLAVASSLLDFVLVVGMSIWWLLAQPGLRRFTLSLFRPDRRERAAKVLADMGGTMGAYVRAFLLDSLLVGVATYIGLTVIGVDYAVVLALIASIGELVPILGPILSAVPAIGVALLDSPTQALIVLGFYIVLQQIESNVLIPLLVQEQADIPPVLAVFALVVGAALLGALGALIAIPVAGALRVLVLEAIAPAVRRWSGAT